MEPGSHYPGKRQRVEISCIQMVSLKENLVLETDTVRGSDGNRHLCGPFRNIAGSTLFCGAKQVYVCPDFQQPGCDLDPPCHDKRSALVEVLATEGASKPQKRAL